MIDISFYPSFDRYNSVVDQVDRQLVKPVPSPPQPIVEKKGGWFGKKRKDDKSKNTRVDSPSKELRNSSETPKASSPASIVATHDSSQPMVNGAAGSEASPTSAESVLDKIRELGIDFFSVDFEGVTLASTLCLSCETITEQKEIMIDLSVPITENMETQELDETFIQVSYSTSHNEILFCFDDEILIFIPKRFFPSTELVYHPGTISR